MTIPTVMKQTLRALFKNYGDVLDVVAHSNLRMRGQAFVSFSDKEIAKKAQREVNRFPLYSKPMVRCQCTLPERRLMTHFLLQQISFAKTRSDAVVKSLDAEHFDQHKNTRLENKSSFTFLANRPSF